MVEEKDASAELMLAILRGCCLEQGADVCDRCNDVIWPEFELVRCDFCVGEYGPPERERVEQAMKRHGSRIRYHSREDEMWDEEEPHGPPG